MRGGGENEGEGGTDVLVRGGGENEGKGAQTSWEGGGGGGGQTNKMFLQ